MAKGLNVALMREMTGLNGTVFWKAVGVTQSGGSRYEGGRRLPKPVQQLLRLVYIEKVDLDKIRREDIELIDYLKTQKEVYKRLRAQSAEYHKRR